MNHNEILYTFDGLMEAAREAGAKDPKRVASGIYKACNLPPVMSIDDSLASLRKWQPQLFRKHKPCPTHTNKSQPTWG
jgi:hypothetical protein